VDDAAAPAAAEGRSRPGWERWALGVLTVLVMGAAAHLLGWDIRGWLSDVWDTLTTISVQDVVGACAMYVVGTTATAFAWYSILRFAYPSQTRWRDVLAGYAVSVALNDVLPANIGTFVLLVLLTVVIAKATFAGILGAYAVEKIFFTVAGAFVYLYLFLTVEGSFDIDFSWVKDNPIATAILLLGSAFLIAIVVRRLWPRVVRWWDQAKDGGAILARPGRYFLRVFLPSLVAWLAGLVSTAILLNAYGIPVTFDTLMHVLGGNSLANVTSVTPGGAGVTQAFNVASLRGVATSADATAYSVASQLLNTAWNIVFAIGVVVWAWGWSGGKQLVSSSYADAKRMEEEQREARRVRKEERERAREGAPS
jgi:uncharacterized membrane protein YbhN (UPF0104 family)